MGRSSAYVTSGTGRRTAGPSAASGPRSRSARTGAAAGTDSSSTSGTADRARPRGRVVTACPQFVREGAGEAGRRAQPCPVGHRRCRGGQRAGAREPGGSREGTGPAGPPGTESAPVAAASRSGPGGDARGGFVGCGGRGHSARRPLEQLPPGPPLRRAHPRRHRGLGQPEQPGGTGERTRPVHGEEGPQQVWVRGARGTGGLNGSGVALTGGLNSMGGGPGPARGTALSHSPNPGFPARPRP